MNREDRVKLELEVENIQQDFEYTEKHPNHWICKNKSGTSVYCFEIIIGEFQIYAGGDIDPLVWRVGERMGYGMGFLAGDDLNYYIYSKLDTIFRDKRELDEDALNSWLGEIREAATDDDEDNEKIYKIDELEDELCHCDSIEQTFNAIYNALPEEFCDGAPNITKPSHGIMFGIYMVNHAAKKIAEMKVSEINNA